jgi:addiction module RelB/DinJ family antitoxin
MIKTLTWWLLSDRQRSKHNKKETNRPVSLILFVKENPYLSFTAVTINFLPYPGWWVWTLGLQFSKTANVNSRISLEVKQQAEHILDNLGIPRAVAIDMFYRQIIAHNGIPFSVTLPTYVPARDEIKTDDQPKT